MNLNQVTVPCLDLDESVAFYRALGLELIVYDSPKYARFECPSGTATFSLHLADRVASEGAPIVYFELDDLDVARARFEALRKPNADAIADMAVENFVEMRASTADPRFLLEKSIEKRLLAELPGEFVSRYALVTFSRAPYRVAYDAGRIASGIVSELAEGVRSAAEVDLGRRPVRRLLPRLGQDVGRGLRPLVEELVRHGEQVLPAEQRRHHGDEDHGEDHEQAGAEREPAR